MSAFKLSDVAMARRRERDRRDRRPRDATIKHEYGNCALEAGLCPACYEDEIRELRMWCAAQPDPRPEDDPLDYWRRIGGPFLDAWHAVASERIRRMRAAVGACPWCGHADCEHAALKGGAA